MPSILDPRNIKAIIGALGKKPAGKPLSFGDDLAAKDHKQTLDGILSDPHLPDHYGLKSTPVLPHPPLDSNRGLIAGASIGTGIGTAALGAHQLAKTADDREKRRQMQDWSINPGF